MKAPASDDVNLRQKGGGKGAVGRKPTNEGSTRRSLATKYSLTGSVNQFVHVLLLIELLLLFRRECVLREHARNYE